MTMLKITAEDLEKLMKEVRSSRFAHFINVSVEPQRISFSYEGDDHKLNKITIFDAETKTSPIIQRTESL